MLICCYMKPPRFLPLKSKTGMCVTMVSLCGKKHGRDQVNPKKNQEKKMKLAKTFDKNVGLSLWEETWGGINLTPPKKNQEKNETGKDLDENIYIYIYFFSKTGGIFFCFFFFFGLDSLEIIGGGSSQLVKFN